MKALRTRLLLAAAAWIVIALAIAAWALTGLFREHVESELAQRMRGHLDQLIASLVVEPDGGLRLARELSEPAFRQPASGLYWLVESPVGDAAPAAPDTTVLRSRSLWDHPLVLAAAPRADAQEQRLEATGPRGEPLVLWARTVQLAGASAPLRAAVGADITRLRGMTRSFARTLGLSLAVLAAGLLAAAVLQVQLGLTPLRRLRASLQAMRAGRAARVEGRYPDEVQPLVEDLNALLDENAAIVERARTRTGNLAHALKTPLAVIGNAAASVPAPVGAQIAEQAQRMARQVEWHLAQARAAATARHRGPGAEVGPVLEDLRRTIARLHTDRGLEIRLDAAPGLRFRGEPQDLQEMVGNLLDNAAKWARGRIRLSAGGGPADAPSGADDDARLGVEAEAEAAGLWIRVDDDGPGIPADERERVLQRGERLDESRPGTGLGLAIVDDLARLHGGRLLLGDSPLGGLRATLRWPPAGAPAAGGVG